MAYIFQSVSINQILTAAIYNQTEFNIRDHEHGVAGVLSVSSDSLTDAFTKVENRSPTDVSVANTAVETVVYSYTVPANRLGTNRMLRLFLVGHYLNNSGASQSFTVRVKYGGTVGATDGTTLGTSANSSAVILHARLGAANSATAQRMSTEYMMLTPEPTQSNMRGKSIDVGSVFEMVIDSGVAQALEVTVQHGAANANLTFVKKFAILELVGSKG